jgi:hypothetical protein
MSEKQISPEEYRKFITSLLNNHLIPFYYEKNKQYGGASLDGGRMALVGNMVRQTDKMKRYQKLIETWLGSGLNSDPPEALGESIYDTISDQLGYALLGLTICAREGLSPITLENVGCVPADGREVFSHEFTDGMAHPFGYEKATTEVEPKEPEVDPNLILDCEDIYLGNMDNQELMASIMADRLFSIFKILFYDKKSAKKMLTKLVGALTALLEKL